MSRNQIYLIRLVLQAFLLNFSTDAKDDFSGKIDYVLNRQRQTKHRTPFITLGEAAYGCFIKYPGVDELSEEKRLEYIVRQYAEKQVRRNIGTFCLRLMLQIFCWM